MSRGFDEGQELRPCRANCPVCDASINDSSPEHRKLDSLLYTGGNPLFHTFYSFKPKLLKAPTRTPCMRWRSILTKKAGLRLETDSRCNPASSFSVYY